MTQDITHLVLEHLPAIRSDMDEVKQGVSSLERQMAAMGQQLAELTAAVQGNKRNNSI
ncbi:hypothetical protein Thiowin_00865 [Thiorhodovibrio winogradskyi]|uniref:Uncharacterized protein n=1 Tax=Thiorhodovibrio winogradskyi TaxID=77007 RepID=A0ABZ0S4D9_9GAMM|nr:hypothetical protein [Thiorhodovibrio winogradskyi]